MREINAQQITSAVKDIAIKANYFLGNDVIKALKDRYEKEESPVGKEILNQIMKNDNIAASEHMPICQILGLRLYL